MEELADVLRWASFLLAAFNVGMIFIIAQAWWVQEKKHGLQAGITPYQAIVLMFIADVFLISMAVYEGIGMLGEGWSWRLMLYPPAFVFEFAGLRMLGRKIRHEQANMTQIELLKAEVEKRLGRK